MTTIHKAHIVALSMATSHYPRREFARMMDMRTTFDREVKSILDSRAVDKDGKTIWNKRKERRQRRFEFTNVLSSPLVKDYINNKRNIKAIHGNRIEFYNGRNHWAKNEFDLKILKILRLLKARLSRCD